ncbi:MAG: D-tyrosyl-tRNA(Tyr) deacylase [Clostridiales bacterium]|nr:D-tyrosyl-tRNA(Tyr) deacylase [Clostridiales bacterium]
MRAVIQKVKNANVKVDGDTVGEIQKGFLIFLGIEAGDTQSDLAYIVGKISKIRIFEDADDKMNLSIKDVGGAVLSISQFTLLGDARKGNRPSLTGAEKPEKAKEIYLKFNEELRKEGIKVAEGIFQADMEVSLVNDGPVTILLDSRKLF